MYDLKKYFLKSINLITLFFFIWILSALCMAKKINYICKVDWKIGNIGLIIIALCFLWLFITNNKEKGVKKININRLVFVVTIGVFFLEVYICYKIFFETGWDSGGYIIPAARTLLEKGDVTDLNNLYFKTYPNNLFLVNLYYVLLVINEKLGVFNSTYQLMIIVIINCAISSISCWLVYLIAKRKVSTKYSLLGYVLTVVLVGLSPWNVICYSDAIALFFPIFIIYIYTENRICRCVKCFAVLIIGYLGYCVKPQVAIVIIAIVITELIKNLKKCKKEFLIRECVTVFCAIIVIVGFSVTLKNLYEKEGFIQDSNREFGLTHFFMMGLNPERGGVWAEEDVETSMNCETAEQRKEKNIEVSKQRLNEYGVVGYAKFLTKKMLTNYNDGTFAWGVEGGFYYLMLQDNGKVSTFFKNIYYNDGKYYGIYSQIVQFLWIVVLTGGGIATVYEFKNNKKEANYITLQLCILGITLFELLFEARARYLYLYVPIYILIYILKGDYIENYIGKLKNRLYYKCQ